MVESMIIMEPQSIKFQIAPTLHLRVAEKICLCESCGKLSEEQNCIEIFVIRLNLEEIQRKPNFLEGLEPAFRIQTPPKNDGFWYVFTYL